MTEYEEKFYKLKNEMDKKTFVYDERQPWEDEIEQSINGMSFAKFVNDLFCLLQPSETEAVDFVDIEKI